MFNPSKLSEEVEKYEDYEGEEDEGEGVLPTPRVLPSDEVMDIQEPSRGESEPTSPVARTLTRTAGVADLHVGSDAS